jgi:recombination protein RecA
MANHALALVEAALRARKLDRTLTWHPTAHSPRGGDPATALPARPAADAAAATDLARLDEAVGGGLPRGQLSEIVGARSSGRTALLLQLLAAATRRGEIAALVDTFDRLDVASAAAAEIDLDRLLWIRGEAGSADRAVERGLKALNLVLQAGGFGVVAIDLADAPPAAVRGMPFTTWLRVQRTIEGSETACVIVGPQPLGRSAGGLTLSLAGRPRWSSFLTGFDVAVRVVSPRRQVDGRVAIAAHVW